MREPIKSGDNCIVTNGLGGQKSPNAGLQVRVQSLVGEHSQLGRIWRCAGEGVVQLGDAGNYVATNWADFPSSWLIKIEPNQETEQQQKHEELQS